MKTAVVLSTQSAFIQSIQQIMDVTFEVWKVLEAIELWQVKEFLERGGVHIVIIDYENVSGKLETLTSYISQSCPDTWCIVASNKNHEIAGAMNLPKPIKRDSLLFFMQRLPSEDFVHGQWNENNSDFIEPILLEHFWLGLINGWMLSNRTMIMLAARRMNNPNLENARLLPIIAKMNHNKKTVADKHGAAQDHLYFHELLRDNVILGSRLGAAIDIMNQKWVIILYLDKSLGLNNAEIARRCGAAIVKASESDWSVSFYIGCEVLPEQLFDMIGRLTDMSEQDVGFKTRISFLDNEGINIKTTALPDMALWEAMLTQGRYKQLKAPVRECITELADADAINEAWVRDFRQAFLHMIYNSLCVHGIPAHEVMSVSNVDEDGRAMSVQSLIEWTGRLIDKIDEFLSGTQPDTVVKKAQKYILQNLDKELTRKSIAEEVFISEGYLGRLFKKELKMNLTEYIFTERMKLAARLLSQTDFYVTSIALSVGYSNFPYFSTQFKKYSGFTPVEYRKNNKEF